MTSLATSVSNSTLTTTQAYLTPAEYRASKLGISVNDLVPGGNQATQDAALVTLIARASAWADRICNQPLGADLHTEDAWARVNRDGYLVVPVRYWPVTELVSARVGASVSTAASVVSGTDIRIGATTIALPVATTISYVGNQPPQRYGIGSRLYVSLTYVSGWPATTLATSASAGASAIVVGSNLGIYAGTQLLVADGTSSETVTVAATPTTSTVAVSVPLGFAHTASTTNPVGVSALPQDIKQAVTHLVNVFIRSRGTTAIEMADITQEPTKVLSGEAGMSTDLALATCILSPTYERTGW